ncbi:MAG: NAD-dependent epimerase/dehydratase family protein [Sphingobacteriaceae bacterium]|nr:NAD-dependent epimerase/dehydratase family protein [Sphingobacteriaceae bacterium]
MILVSGATGIIGSHVVMNLLLKGEKVIACTGNEINKIKLKKLLGYYQQESLYSLVIWREMLFNDIYSIETALENVRAVYHCAGIVSFNSKDRKKLYEINEYGTANLVNACLTMNIPLCHVSSIATLNNADYKNELNEDVFWKKSGNESDYAISKYKGELEVWRGIEEGLNAVIVNPGIVLSPGFWEQSSSQLFGLCDKGLKYYTSGISAYITADDTSKIMIELMNKRKYANRYILIENNYSYKNVLQLISTHLDKSTALKEIGPFTITLFYRLEKIMAFFRLKKARLSKSAIRSLYNQQKFSNKKISAELNYNFTAISGEIERICKIYRKEHPSRA